MATVFGILAAGQIVNTNDWFPLGSLSQYAYGRPLDSPTKSIRIRALTHEGHEVGVPLSTEGSGLPRAEVEGQVDRIIENPGMLEGLARSWSEIHPHQPQFTRL